MQARQPIPLGTQQPFIYSQTFNLTANAASSQLLILDNDSDFDLLAITAATDQDGTLTAATGPAQLPENFTLLITNQSTGRQFSNEPLRRGNLCGNAFAFVLPEGRPIRFQRKTQLQLQIQNLVAVAIVVQVAFKGYKILGTLPGA